MADFNIAISYVLGNEGGYSCNPCDPGGETNFGICKRDHPEVDIRNLTRAGAIEIYREQYWCYEGLQDQAIATKLLDMAVNMEGTGKAGAAVRIAQQAAQCQVPDAVADGVFGPLTRTAINRCEPITLLRDMCRLAADHYRKLVERNPKLIVFLEGWLARAAKCAPDE